VDLERARVRVEKTIEREVEKTAQRTFTSERNAEATEDHVREVRAAAEREIERERERTRQEATSDIEARLGDLRAELDEIAVRVTQGALRKKASRMGEVESVVEDPATGSLTIRVRV
jgi:F0F1-type ATP synthase membrane subunit b/b'